MFILQSVYLSRHFILVEIICTNNQKPSSLKVKSCQISNLSLRKISQLICMANEIHSICGGKYRPVLTHLKCAKQLKKKNSRKPVTTKLVLSHKAWEKGHQWLAEQKSIRVKFLFAQLARARWVKKRYPLLFRKYGIKEQHLYRTHKKADIHQCTCRKKRHKIFNRKSINQSPVQMPRSNRRRRRKSVFPPSKDIGTRVGDELVSIFLTREKRKLPELHISCFALKFN